MLTISTWNINSRRSNLIPSARSSAHEPINRQSPSFRCCSNTRQRRGWALLRRWSTSSLMNYEWKVSNCLMDMICPHCSTLRKRASLLSIASWMGNANDQNCRPDLILSENSSHHTPNPHFERMESSWKVSCLSQRSKCASPSIKPLNRYYVHSPLSYPPNHHSSSLHYTIFNILGK